MSRRPLNLALLAVLAATAIAANLAKTSNQAGELASLSTTSNVESAALYCAGLGASGSPAGRVVFFNTADHPRTLGVRVDANGALSKVRSIVLAAHATTSVTPTGPGHWYGVSAVTNGGGVVADVLNESGTASVPCVDAGYTNWYASGLSTTVGARAYVVLYNPSATTAVTNVTLFTPSGFAAPASFQGISIGAHDVVALNLNAPAIDVANIGVHVRVLRSAVVVTAVQESGLVTTFSPGSAGPTTVTWFPQVTTSNGAIAQVRVANPSASTATVTATIGLAPFHPAPETITVAPYTTGVITVTPNSAVPAHGYAVVRVSASAAIVAGLVTGTSSGVGLSAPNPPASVYLVSDFAGRGFDAVSATNAGTRPLTIAVSVIGSKAPPRTLSVAVGATVSLRPLVGAFRGRSIVIESLRPDLIVAATLPTRPAGVVMFAPLYGG